MTTGNTDAAGSGLHAPPIESATYVRCAGFRCLAYRDLDRRWRNYFTHELLPEDVKDLSDSPTSDSPA